MRHFVSITELSKKELLKLIDNAIQIKTSSEIFENSLVNKTMVMIFEKPSLRTRLSFEAGMTQLGGHAIYLAPEDISMGKREPVEDVAIVTSRMSDIIMARTFKHETIVKLAEHSLVPVINALSDLEHPCQILADLMTIKEIKGKLEGLKVTFVGDGNNNVTHSLALACGILGMDFSYASPKGYQMDKEVFKQVKTFYKKNGYKILETNDHKEAVKESDVVVTDTWVSMGSEEEKEERLKIFKDYQVNAKLMGIAKKDAIFMHCLPAYRGNEVTGEVIDGSRSVVYQEAENRLHAQKALICFLLKIKV